MRFPPSITHFIHVFSASFVGVLLLIGLPLVSGKLPFVSPLSNSSHIFTLVGPKLKVIPNSFSVKKQNALVPVSYAGSDYEQASAYAVVDMETGEVIADKNIDKKLAFASLTKVMTAVVALDLIRPGDLCSFNDRAARQIPTKIGANVGEIFTYEELLHASLLTSANDATEAIKECVDRHYGEPVFIEAMNYRAQFLGLSGSHFTNAEGFDNDEHLSTVEDLTTLAHYALTNYSLIAEIVAKDEVTLPANHNHRRFRLINWNGLLGVYPDVIGVKIGNTGDAGKTTIVVSSREGKKLIAVVLGATDIWERDLWASQLLDYGYEKLLDLPPVEVTRAQLREKYLSWQ